MAKGKLMTRIVWVGVGALGFLGYLSVLSYRCPLSAADETENDLTDHTCLLIGPCASPRRNHPKVWSVAFAQATHSVWW